MKRLGIGVIVMAWTACLVACGDRNKTAQTEDFTKVDSLTENYLTLQDSMLQAWNVMVKDENEKLRSMHELLHHLFSSPRYDQAHLVSLEQRMQQLDDLRLSQASIGEPHTVEEYDFASNSLITELITLAESDPEFSSNKELMNFVDQIRTADQRVSIYREEYDRRTSEFNAFLDENKSYLNDIDDGEGIQKRPLFSEDRSDNE